MNTTPVSLLERLRKPDDQEAWSRFVDLYTPLIYSWARKVGLQPQDAADLVQEVFTILVQKMPEFEYDPSRHFRAWLKTVTLNKWRENRRRMMARRETTTVPVHDDILASAGSEDFWEVDYRRHLVHQALRLMKTDFNVSTWQAFEAVMAGRSAIEVAAEMGLTPKSVYMAKYRILNRLREELAGMLQ